MKDKKNTNEITTSTRHSKQRHEMIKHLAPFWQDEGLRSKLRDSGIRCDDLEQITSVETHLEQVLSEYVSAILASHSHELGCTNTMTVLDGTIIEVMRVPADLDKKSVAGSITVAVDVELSPLRRTFSHSCTLVNLERR